MRSIGISSINFHFEIPQHWKVDKFELKSKGNSGSELRFKIGNL